MTVNGDTTAGASAFAITTPISITGPTGANGLTINGGGSGSNNRFARVTSAGNLTLTNLTIANFRHKGGDGATGHRGGGGAAGMGGAIFNEGTLAVVGSTISGNTATGGSGGNRNTGVTQGGGGGGLLGNGSVPAGGGPKGGGLLTSGGFGGGSGGGNSSTTPASLGIRGGFGGGGGGQGSRDGGGAAGGFGGGGGSKYAGTSYGGGGGAYSGGGGGAGLGGAIFNLAGTVTITNSTISGNTTVAGLGGSGAGNGTTSGGGLFNLNGGVTILNSTIAGNTAANGAALTNRAHDATGGVPNANAATVSLANTILDGTGAVMNNKFNANAGAATVTATAPNVLRDAVTNAGGATSGASGAGSFIIGNPLLAALADNGGPTFTMALNSGSPAIDAGNNAAAGSLTTDQRGTGYARVLDSVVDIGAFESTPASLSATLAAGTLTITDTSGKNNSLTVQESGANLRDHGRRGAVSSAPTGGTLSNGNRTLTMPVSSVTAGLTIDAAAGTDAVTFPASSTDPLFRLVGPAVTVLADSITVSNAIHSSSGAITLKRAAGRTAA